MKAEELKNKIEEAITSNKWIKEVHEYHRVFYIKPIAIVAQCQSLDDEYEYCLEIKCTYKIHDENDFISIYTNENNYHSIVLNEYEISIVDEYEVINVIKEHTKF